MSSDDINVEDEIKHVASDLAALSRMRAYLSAEEWFAVLLLISKRLGRHVEAERAALESSDD